MPTNLSTLGSQGLVLFSKGGDKNYYFVLEPAWRKCQLAKPPPAAVSLHKDGAAVGALSASQVFVDFGKLTELDPGLSPPGTGTPGPAPTGQAVIIYDGAKYYGVGADKWQPMVPGGEGDAGVLVNRGAVVATIPKNEIPSGTYCVLINNIAIK
jgi:hypothetical protein